MSNLLIYGDGPDSHTGLARIARDLALISGTLPDFRVGTFGRAAVGSCSLPFPQYSFGTADQWGEQHIEKVWSNFTTGSGEGQILTVWDASRLLWFAGLSSTGNQQLDTFLGPNRTFAKWGYFMIDGTGPDGQTLPTESREVLKAYDRVVVSSNWGADVARRSGVDCEWIPHPINGEKFMRYSAPVTQSFRNAFDVAGRVVVGCCMTNQARKDWQIGRASCRERVYHPV